MMHQCIPTMTKILSYGHMIFKHVCNSSTENAFLSYETLGQSSI